jgi:hypothetical protein
VKDKPLFVTDGWEGPESRTIRKPENQIVQAFFNSAVEFAENAERKYIFFSARFASSAVR